MTLALLASRWASQTILLSRVAPWPGAVHREGPADIYSTAISKVAAITEGYELGGTSNILRPGSSGKGRILAGNEFSDNDHAMIPLH